MTLIFIPILLTWWLKHKYTLISPIFIFLIAVGVMQGLCSNIAYVVGMEDINWGMLKGVIISMILIATIFKSNIYKKTLPTSLLIWSATYLLFCVVIMMHVFEVMSYNYSINILNVLQNFALVNMLMVFVAFFWYEKELANAIIELLIGLGKFVSVIAIAQWIASRYLGIDSTLLMAAKGFGSLNSDDGAALRVFSVFYTHYGLSAFLTLVTILYVSRSLFTPKSFRYSTLLLLVVAHSLTYNLTGLLLTMSGCMFSFVVYINLHKIHIPRRKLIHGVVLVLLGIGALMFNDTFTQRLGGIVDYSATSTGAGNSLYERSIFINNAINVLSSNPNGVGLSLTDISQNSYENLGYARTGILKQDISADAWFLWLILQIGLLWGGVMLLVYAIPFLKGLYTLKSRDLTQQWHVAAFASILFVVLFGSISNSPILNYPPSNALMWCAVGALFAIRKSACTPSCSA